MLRHLWNFCAPILRALGLLAPRRPDPAEPTAFQRAMRIWSRTPISVWREEPAPGLDVALPDLCGHRRASETVFVTGFGNACQLARYHAGDAENGPGTYLLNLHPEGETIARIFVDEHRVLHVLQWCAEDLFAKHARRPHPLVLVGAPERRRRPRAPGSAA